MIERSLRTQIATPKESAFSTPKLRRVLFALVRFAHTKPLGALGGFFVALVIFLAIFAEAVAPYVYNKRNLRSRLKPPSVTNYMGTDSLGRDVFSRIVYGARVSVSVGFGGIGLDTLLATIIGIIVVCK